MSYNKTLKGRPTSEHQVARPSFGAPHVFVLAVVDGEDAHQVHRVQRAETIIGRDGEADFVLPDGEVSKRHCLVRTDGPVCTVTDLGSLNGTRLNGRPLRGGVAQRVRQGRAVGVVAVEPGLDVDPGVAVAVDRQPRQLVVTQTEAQRDALELGLAGRQLAGPPADPHRLREMVQERVEFATDPFRSRLVVGRFGLAQFRLEFANPGGALGAGPGVHALVRF